MGRFMCVLWRVTGGGANRRHSPTVYQGARWTRSRTGLSARRCTARDSRQSTRLGSSAGYCRLGCDVAWAMRHTRSPTGCLGRNC